MAGEGWERSRRSTASGGCGGEDNAIPVRQGVPGPFVTRGGVQGRGGAWVVLIDDGAAHKKSSVMRPWRRRLGTNERRGVLT